MSEHRLLSASIKDRGAWETIKDTVDESIWSPEGGIIWNLVGEYYSLDKSCKHADPTILCERAERQVVSNKISEIVVQGIKSLVELDVSAANVAAEAVSLKAHILGNKIQAKLSSPKPSPQEVKELMNEWISVHDKGENAGILGEFLSGTSASELVARTFTHEGLIKLYPKALNDAIDGGIRGGHHVLVFAPTEMGKTLFTINLCYGFLRQNLRVLYVGNEDPAADIQMRMMSRLTGMSKYEIIDNPIVCDDLLSKRNWGKFIFANFSPGTFGGIHKAIDEYGPQVLVLDQLRNINVSSENRTQALEKAATEARNTAKKYGIPCISVTQAADSASGKKVLDRGDVDGSNVGIPAQIDLMIGLGADGEMEATNMRMISLVKNKLSGRHTPIPIEIDPLHSRVLEEFHESMRPAVKAYRQAVEAA
jgi:KaiC/GvpD/RAD55 family RecA-like ATPase